MLAPQPTPRRPPSITLIKKRIFTTSGLATTIPTSGVFLTQAPYLGEVNIPPSLHRHLYTYANPLRYVDLTGYQSKEASGNKEKSVLDQINDVMEPVAHGAGALLRLGLSGGGLLAGYDEAFRTWEEQQETPRALLHK